MRKAIREHLRDFVAIAMLLVIGLVATALIISQQQANLPAWVPILGSDNFELKARFSTAQAVTPGQGQSVDISGVKVGSISGVDLDQGEAVVTMAIDRKYASLIHPDATLLLRPRTGLQDMTIEVDPGTSSKEVSEGSTLPVAQSAPNVQPDQILATLDGDTRGFLQLLLQAGSKGLGGRGRQLSAGLKRFEPTARDLSQIGSALVERRQNIRRVITNFGLLSQALGRSDTQLAGFVRSSNQVLGSFAKEQSSIQGLLQELPGTLRQTRSALASGSRFANTLAPASRRLIPAAQALGPALQQTRPLFRKTVGPIQHQIRPFARKVQRPLKHIDQASQPLANTTSGLTRGFNNLNLLFNALAYNPAGSDQEGYLFWLAWLNHDTNALFFTQDAGGPLRHGLVLQSCDTAQAAEILTTSDPFLKTLQQLSGVPSSSEIAAHGGCP